MTEIPTPEHWPVYHDQGTGQPTSNPPVDDPSPAHHPAAETGGPHRPPSFVRRVAGITLVALLAGGSGAAVATLLDDADAPSSSVVPASTSGEVRSVQLSGETLDVAQVVEAVGPSVVSIQTQVGGPAARGGGGGGGGAGTGVVISSDGEVLTNAHVVAGANSIFVTFAGESQSREATLVGADPANDLALLQIDDARDLPVASLGSSDALAVGDDVVAIGNALALRGGPTVTTGIVSGLDRSLPTDDATMTGLLQTDASISSGNSGGPLVNAVGEVIGINTAVAASGMGRSAENIGFAIPIDQARPVVDRLRSGTEADKPGFLGVGIADPTDGSRGGVVSNVEPGSPADEGGVREGDLITAIDDEPVDGAAALAGAIQGNGPGDEVTVSLVRDGDERTLTVVLGARTT